MGDAGDCQARGGVAWNGFVGLKPFSGEGDLGNENTIQDRGA